MNNKFRSGSETGSFGFVNRTLGALGCALLLAGTGCSSSGSSFDSEMDPVNTGVTPNNNGAGGQQVAGGAGGASTTGDTNNNGMMNGGTGGASVGGDGGTANGGTGGEMVDPGPECPKPAPEICHEFYANDNSRNNLNYVNEFEPDKNWTVNVGDTTVNSPRQVAIVDNPDAQTGKAVLVSLNKGYAEFDVVDGTRLVFVQSFSGVTGAVRLPDGNTALGIGNSNIRIVGPGGNTVREFGLPGGGDLRVLHRDADGNFWFGRQLDIFQVNDQGAQLWTAKLPSGGKAYAVFPRDGGGAYATSGNPSTVVEYDGAGSIVNQVGGKQQFADLGLDFFSGFVRLANGNFVAANWLGHIQPEDDTPHLVEFTPANEVVWTWGNQTLARQITNVLVLK